MNPCSVDPNMTRGKPFCTTEDRLLACPRKPCTGGIDTTIIHLMFETLAISRDDPKTTVEVVAGSVTHIVWKVPIASGQALTGRAAEKAWFIYHRLLTRI